MKALFRPYPWTLVLLAWSPLQALAVEETDFSIVKPFIENPWVLTTTLDVRNSSISNIDFVSPESEVPNFSDRDLRTSAGRDGFYTSVKPTITLTNRTRDLFNVFVQYFADGQLIRDKNADNRIYNFLSAIVDGKTDTFSYKVSTFNLLSNGNDEPPVFGSPFGTPPSTTVLGNLPLALARDALYTRNFVELKFRLGDFFIRPVAYYSKDDFRTKRRDVTPLEGSISASDAADAFLDAGTAFVGAPTPTAFQSAGVFLDAVAFRENLVDRDDKNAGFDIGYRILPGTDLIFGVRFGEQDQEENKSIISQELSDEFRARANALAPLVGSPLDPGTFGLVVGLFNANADAFGLQFNDAVSANRYERFIIGIEGNPVDWLDITLHAGIDRRHYDSRSRNITPPTNDEFDLDDERPYLRGEGQIRLTAFDKIDFSLDWFEQPAFAGFRVFEDVRVDLTYTHTFSKRLSSSLRINYMEAQFDDGQLQRQDQVQTFILSTNYQWSQTLAIGAEVNHIKGRSLKNTPANNVFAALSGISQLNDLADAESTGVSFLVKYTF